MNAFARESLNQDVRKQLTAYLNGGRTDSGFTFFTCSHESEHANILSELRGVSPNTIVGGTTVSSPFHPDNATLPLQLVAFDKPGLRHSIVLSEPVTPATNSADMGVLYDACLAGLAGTPKLFFLILPIVPHLFIDNFIGALFELAGSIPIFGGMVVDEFDQGQGMVFLDHQAYRDRMVLIALGGDIEPVFGAGYEITTPSAYSPVVTIAVDNVVQMVDDITVSEYLEKIGLGAPDIVGALEEWPLPVWIRHPAGVPNSSARVNSLVKILPDGSGVFSSTVPVGSSIRMAFLTRANIANSAENAVASLLSAMREKEKNGYIFNQVLAISSIARYYVMSGGEQIEADILARSLPPGLTRFGVYVLSEICPMSNDPGQNESRRHIQTLALCAL